MKKNIIFLSLFLAISGARAMYDSELISLSDIASPAVEPVTNEQLLNKPIWWCLCEKEFDTHKGLNLHIRNTHEGRIYPCKLCVKVFKSSAACSRHLQDHLGTRKCECKICHNIFANKDTLTDHVQRVHEEIRILCSVCLRQLTRRAYKDHMNLHTGKKPYRCTKCDVAFPYKASLNNHMKKCTGR